MPGNHDGERKRLLQVLSGAGDSFESGSAGKCQPDSLCGSQAIKTEAVKKEEEKMKLTETENNGDKENDRDRENDRNGEKA